MGANLPRLSPRLYLVHPAQAGCPLWCEPPPPAPPRPRPPWGVGEEGCGEARGLAGEGVQGRWAPRKPAAGTLKVQCLPEWVQRPVQSTARAKPGRCYITYTHRQRWWQVQWGMRRQIHLPITRLHPHLYHWEYRLQNQKPGDQGRWICWLRRTSCSEVYNYIIKSIQMQNELQYTI